MRRRLCPPFSPLSIYGRDPSRCKLGKLRDELKAHAIVNPDSLTENGDDDLLLQRDREKRLAEYAECDGLVLLRVGTDEPFKLEVMAAYKDRQHLYQKLRRNIPWVIADRHGSAPPVFSAYRVPCVPATCPDWPQQVVSALSLDTRHPS